MSVKLKLGSDGPKYSNTSLYSSSKENSLGWSDSFHWQQLITEDEELPLTSIQTLDEGKNNNNSTSWKGDDLKKYKVDDTEFHINRWTLSLAPKVSAVYFSSHFTQQQWILRIIIFGGILVNVYGLYRPLVHYLLALRVISLLMFITTFLLSFFKRPKISLFYKNAHHPLIIVYFLIYFFSVMLEKYLVNEAYVIFFMVVNFSAFYGTGCLLFLWVVVFNLIISLALVLYLFLSLNPLTSLTYIMVCLMVSLAGNCYLYNLEKSRKQNFLREYRLEQQTKQLSVEKGRSEHLLNSILPPFVVKILKEREAMESSSSDPISKDFPDCTILFCDIVGFTSMASHTQPQDLVKLLNEVFSEFDFIMSKHSCERIKTLGDCYVAAGGIMIPSTSHPQDIVDSAIAMIQSPVLTKNSLGVQLKMRIGVSSGPVLAGVIGINKFQFDIWGDTVTIANKMEQTGMDGKVHVSESTYQRLPSDFYAAEESGSNHEYGNSYYITPVPFKKRPRPSPTNSPQMTNPLQASTPNSPSLTYNTNSLLSTLPNYPSPPPQTPQSATLQPPQNQTPQAPQTPQNQNQNQNANNTGQSVPRLASVRSIASIGLVPPVAAHSHNPSPLRNSYVPPRSASDDGNSPSSPADGTPRSFRSTTSHRSNDSNIDDVNNNGNESDGSGSEIPLTSEIPPGENAHVTPEGDHTDVNRESLGPRASTLLSQSHADRTEERFREKAKINKFILQFKDKLLEDLYIRNTIRTNVKITEVYIALGYAMLFVFFACDLITYKEYNMSFFSTRYLYIGITPLFLVAFLANFHPKFRYYSEILCTILMTIFGVVVVLILVFSPYQIVVGALTRMCMVLFYMNLFYHIRLLYVLVAVITVFATLHIAALLKMNTLGSVVYSTDYLGFALFLLMQSFSTYIMKKEMRQAFVLRRLVRYRGIILAEERKKSGDLLLNILPAPIAEKLQKLWAETTEKEEAQMEEDLMDFEKDESEKKHIDKKYRRDTKGFDSDEETETHGRIGRGKTLFIAESYTCVGALFIGIVGLDTLPKEFKVASKMVEILNELFSHFDRLAFLYKLEKIKTIGTVYFAVGGLHSVSDFITSVADMSLAARALVLKESGGKLNSKIGIAIGPSVAGIIGSQKFVFDIWGDTINCASRMESTCPVGKIQVTEETRAALKTTFRFASRGSISVKGKGILHTFFLTQKRGIVEGKYSKVSLGALMNERISVGSLVESSEDESELSTSGNLNNSTDNESNSGSERDSELKEVMAPAKLVGGEDDIDNLMDDVLEEER